MDHNNGERRGAEAGPPEALAHVFGSRAFCEPSLPGPPVVPREGQPSAFGPGVIQHYEYVTNRIEDWPPWTVDLGSAPGAGVVAVFSAGPVSLPAPGPLSARRQLAERVADDPEVTPVVHAPAPRARTGTTLVRWVVLVVILNAALWVTGLRQASLREAVEQGTARVEARNVGEERQSVARQAIRSQRSTLSFWTTLALIGDFVVGPVGLATRAAMVAVALGSLAALFGQPAGFSEAWDACAQAQGYWVLGLAVQVALMIYLRTDKVDTSVALLLPAGTYRAPVWAAARQADAFAVWGWAALAYGGWRRGQANPIVALGCVGLLATVEAAVRAAFTLLVGAGMRLSFLPDRPWGASVL